MAGKVYMIPTTLGGEQINDVIPESVQRLIVGLRHFIVEDIKSARRYLRRIDRDFPIDDSTFFELNKRTDVKDLSRFLKPATEGFSIGVISEAGCPGVADPGAEIVAIAHEKGIRVAPLVGPSSILLALMGSGFSGQEFTFHGYLPKDRKERVKRLKDFEADTRRSGHTHLFMDTPFRNMNVLDDLLNELADTTQLCIASNITLPDESVWTMSVEKWREKAYDLSKKPAMFLIGK
ncbi:SAM-dependent methyltransferase [Crocinitomicaceae bacterium CZZ-1]|uniref:SAM-dependent methyltransferase n=1 Tax=Taishania pollutisoli TaxID=2766479 RepID=A0A8J6U2Q1_9FLAO|nr:SAM-dependent methyltransferase [Taishania pollutisoli]MBC9813495.1 SAM-dependent methyltransferase [Taishania pollutisoli]NGF76069.1 SAM-dependent methyltransferase [Fluviicola sp. SGL-29]